jgi:hypothetical protein
LIGIPRTASRNPTTPSAPKRSPTTMTAMMTTRGL